MINIKFNKEFLFITSELFVILCYGLFTEFDTGLSIAPSASTIQGVDNIVLNSVQKMQSYYPFFQDIHVMIFVGFGFLMAFLKTHSWTSITFNYLIAAWALQISILLTNFWNRVLVDGFNNKISLDLTSLIIGDFGAGVALITMGAVLGKTDLFQLWILITLEIFFYSLNETICIKLLYIVDMGGSIIVHAFGAYFGLAASYFFNPRKAFLSNNDKGNYNSQTIAMLGTLFLWVYWPSFNGGLAPGISQQRVVVNTVLSISASCIAACAVSRIIKNKLDMEVVLNATLAGGVSIGGASDLVVTGVISMIIGTIAGIVSSLGFLFLGPFLRKKIDLHDTCGIHNLHGIPGLLGGIISGFSSGFAQYASKDNLEVSKIFIKVYNGERTFGEQGLMQFISVIITLVIACISGIISGYIASKCGNLDEFFIDTYHFDECDLELNLDSTNSNIDNSDFRNSNIDNSDFRNSNIDNSDFRNSIIDNSDLTNIKFTNSHYSINSNYSDNELIYKNMNDNNSDSNYTDANEYY